MAKWYVRSLAVLACLSLLGVVRAQQSTSFRLQEHTFNNGGHPSAGTTLSSPSFRLSMDALGEAISAVGLGNGLHNMDACFVSTYAPPGEVAHVRFDDAITLRWDAERSVGRYDLYRDTLSTLSGLGYGACFQAALIGATTTDGMSPAAGQGFFYLVTAENRLGEEGTKGFDSLGTERPNAAPCP